MSPESPAAVRPAVKVDALSISYRRFGRPLRVISDVSFAIAPGEAYGLVGESGCGKTTIAMAVMRYLPRNATIESGRITVVGEDLLTLGEGRLRELRGDVMAMVYQDPYSSLNPTIRVGEQIAEVYRYHRNMTRDEALAATYRILDRVQIPDPENVARRYPHQLSGGQQQRVMIAMALTTDPDVLVMDEPTTGLDATVEAEVLDLVARLRSESGASVMYISHNLAIVSRLCDRVGVLYAGRLIEEGPSHEVLSDPRHPYTLGLLRCVPRLWMRKDGRRLDPIPGSLPPLGARIEGCAYAPRCPLARARCHDEAPPLAVTGRGHMSACHFYEEVPGMPSSPESAPPRSQGPPLDDGVLLRVADLVKSYRAGRSRIHAVDGVSLEVRRGQVLGLVGESGSGKTTLAKCLVGLETFSEGRLEFNGRDLAAGRQRRDHELRRDIQMIFQNPDNALNPRRTVRWLLHRCLRLLGGVRSRADRDRQMLELAALVRLEPRHLRARPTALSGGLKQRVAIASAFAGRPQLVVCDEPVSALDVSVQAAILNLLVDLQVRQHVSYVFISHDLAVVRYLADRIAVMYLGQIVDVGAADAVFNPPHHPYTEALASAMPALDHDQARPRIRLEGTVPSAAEPPPGCRFHTRCRRVMDICRTAEPPWQDDGDVHSYRCHIPPDELRAAQGPEVASKP